MDKVVHNAKLETATKNISFSIFSIAVDKEGEFFNNFAMIFRMLEIKLENCEDVDLKYKRAVALLKLSFRAYRDMWQDLHKSEEIKAKLKDVDVSLAKIEKLTYGDSNIISLMLLAGNLSLFEILRDYIIAINEKIFENKFSQLLVVHNQLLGSAIDYYVSVTQDATHSLFESNDIQVKVFGTNNDYLEEIKQILDTSIILHIEKNSGTL